MGFSQSRRVLLVLASVLATVLATACTDDDEDPATATATATASPSLEPTASSTADPDTIVLSWTREGGIAGFCDGLRLTAGHRAILGTCEDPPMDSPDGDIVPNEAIIEFETWRDEFESFEVEWSDDDATADGMTINLSFEGRGNRPAAEDIRRAIADFAGRLHADLVAAQPRVWATLPR